jgi:integrase
MRGELMAKRRSPGEGGVHWDESRQRWIGTVFMGFSPSGKRVNRKFSAKTKTEAMTKLKVLVREKDSGLPDESKSYTVREAVNDFLQFGLSNRSEATRKKARTLCDAHIMPSLGHKKLKDLTAQDVDRWLVKLSAKLATSTLSNVRSYLDRSVRRAFARDLVRRNVVTLTTLPRGQAGRASKGLTWAQARAIISAAEGSSLYAYIVVSLLTGARTEEVRALTWANVDLIGNHDLDPPTPPHIAVWRSVREDGDTKTRSSKRSLALPEKCIWALTDHRRQQIEHRAAAGAKWQDHDLVFCSATGTMLDAANVRRAFRAAIKGATGVDGLIPADWTPQELRHSFVSLLSDQGVPIEHIAQLLGHRSTGVTETVYRHQLRPVIDHGAVAMNQWF